MKVKMSTTQDGRRVGCGGFWVQAPGQTKYGAGAPSEDHRGTLEQGTEHIGLCNELATPSRVSLPPQRQLRTVGASFTWLDSGRNSLAHRSSLIFDRRWTETFFLLLPNIGQL